MKILHFGTSQDFVDVDPERSYRALLGKGLSEELGEPVEVVVRRAWPTERLPLLLREWMEEEEPDVVLMYAVSYWFMYPSVPLKLKRRFGRAGVKLGDAGLGMANVPWLAHNRIFRAGRRLTTRLIGGDTNFTPDEVVEVLAACIREAVRHEGVLVHVSGPGGSNPYGDHSKTALREMEARRQHVTDRLEAICAQSRVSFRRYEKPAYATGEAPKPGRDGLHREEDGMAILAALYVGIIAEAVRAARGTGAAR